MPVPGYKKTSAVTKPDAEIEEVQKELSRTDMNRAQARARMKELSKMPREAPITQGPDELGPRNDLRMRILAMSLFPNIVSAHYACTY